MMERILNNKWLKIALLAVLGLVLAGGLVWAGMQIGINQATRDTEQATRMIPSLILTQPPVATSAPTFQPEATPSPDETVNWKTYINTKYGYNLRYPPNWSETPCQGGTLSDDYLCLLSSDFEASLEGSLLKGSRITLSINDGKNAPFQPNCPENIYGYKFPCFEIQVADLKGWQTVIPKSSSEITTYPCRPDTMYFISNIIGGKQFMFLAEYNEGSRFTTQSIFKEILFTFRFLD